MYPPLNWFGFRGFPVTCNKQKQDIADTFLAVTYKPFSSFLCFALFCDYANLPKKILVSNETQQKDGS